VERFGERRNHPGPGARGEDDERDAFGWSVGGSHRADAHPYAESDDEDRDIVG
jgi:hypothetical protein